MGRVGDTDDVAAAVLGVDVVECGLDPTQSAGQIGSAGRDTTAASTRSPGTTAESGDAAARSTHKWLPLL